MMDIKEDIGEGHGWLTIFAEGKSENNLLKWVIWNTLLVFCKVYDPQIKSMKYLGHFLIESTDAYFLLYLFATELIKDRSGRREYDIYIEEDHLDVKRITTFSQPVGEVLFSIYGSLGPLVQLGIRSGSVIVLVERDQENSSNEIEIKQDLLTLYMNGLDLSADEEPDIVYDAEPKLKIAVILNSLECEDYPCCRTMTMRFALFVWMLQKWRGSFMVNRKPLLKLFGLYLL